jgi:6-phosphofructokinase
VNMHVLGVHLLIIIGGLGTMDLDQILANFRIVANTDHTQ